MRAKDVLGRIGEDVAARHLTDTGLAIVERNWRCRAGELDIIADDAGVLVFCEVKTRSSALYGLPVEAVNPTKAARVRRVAMAWLAARHESGESEYWPDMRFDVVSVLRGHGDELTVEHLRGAF